MSLPEIELNDTFEYYENEIERVSVQVSVKLCSKAGALEQEIEKEQASCLKASSRHPVFFIRHGCRIKNFGHDNKNSSIVVNINNNPFFKVLWSARFSQDQVVINWNPKNRELPLELTQKIDSFWKREIVETTKNEFIFNGELCRLNDWRVQKDKLTLDLGLSDYNELLYSNQFAHDIAERFGKDSLSRALGVSVVLVSDDEQIILIKRSKVVGENPGDLDVLGGHIHPQENELSGVPDPFWAIKAEIKEETHLDLKDDEPLDCIGLIETTDTKKPELLFKATTGLTAEEIISLASFKQSEEVAEFITISNQKKSLAQFLETNSNHFSPSALGVLSVYLQILM